MEWTEETNITFIERIKDFPCLWDVFHEDKKNKSKIASAYRTLAAELNTDVPTLKKRKENIFQTYRNYKRKVARSKVKATSEEEVYEPSWTLYPFLDEFLHTVYTPKGSACSIKEEKRLDFDELQTLDDGDQQGDEDDEFNEADPLELAGQSAGPGPSKLRRIDKTNEVSFANTVLKQVIEINKRILHKTATRSDQTTPARDECSLYGELIAIKLRKLDDAQREFAMFEMDNILYNITLGISLTRAEHAVYPSQYINNKPASPHSPTRSESPDNQTYVSPLTPKVTLNEENHVEESS